MKYNELEEEAKQKALHDYLKGWFETHPDDPITQKELIGICSQSDKDYNVFGDYIDFNEGLENKKQVTFYFSYSEIIEGNDDEVIIKRAEDKAEKDFKNKDIWQYLDDVQIEDV